MAELQPLLPRKIQQSVFAPIAPDLSSSPEMSGLNPGGGGGALGVIAPPPLANIVSNPRMVANSSDGLVNRRSALEADIYKQENPVAPATALGKIGHVAANVGNVLGDIFAPGVMSLIPGTQLGNERKVNLDQSKISDISKQQTEEAQRGQTAANTAYLNARPAIEQAKVLQKLTTGLAPKGIKAVMNPDGTIDTEDDPDSQAYKDRVALNAYRAALQDRAQVQADNQANHYQPGTPQYEENQRKLAQIDTRLHQSLMGLANQQERIAQGAERLGFNEDQYYNPEPTAQERRVGDLGQSAVTQVQTMRQIKNAHPEIFGPMAGRTMTAQAWLGSQSPDAQRFLSASRYLADHSAGVFGSRSVEITKKLEELTDPKTNPEAMDAALDQAETTSQHFVNAGTTHGKGQTGYAASQSQSPSSNVPSNTSTSAQTLPKDIADQIPEGHQATLSDGSVWKKVGGKAEKVK